MRLEKRCRAGHISIQDFWFARRFSLTAAGFIPALRMWPLSQRFARGTEIAFWKRHRLPRISAFTASTPGSMMTLSRMQFC